MPPTKKIDIVLDGTQAFTDEVLRFPGAGAVTLQHDYFEDQGFAVRTAAGGGGTLLVRDTHYTLGNEHISLGSRCSAAQSPTVVAVFNTLTITSASYQNVDLYVSGNYVADSIEGEDVVDPAKREQLEGLLANDLDEGNHLHTDAKGELFELATPDCVSSLGRRPTDDSFVHFEPGMVAEDGRPRYANPVVRWPAEAVANPQDIELTADPIGKGRGVVGVFAEAWNATDSAFHMGASDWTVTNVTISTSERTFKGQRFALLTSVAAGGDAECNDMRSSAAENHVQPWSIVLARGETDTELRMRVVEEYPAEKLHVDINFSTKAVSAATGTVLYERWYGDDVVELGGWTAALTSDTSTTRLRFEIVPSTGGSGTVEAMQPTFTYQANDYFAPLPWRGYGAGAGRLVYPFNEWASSGTIEFYAMPMFGYQIGHFPNLIDNRDPASASTATDYINLYYDRDNDRWCLLVVDDEATPNSIVIGGPTISTDAGVQTWTHFLINWDCTANEADLYIDGTAATSKTTNGTGITNADFTARKWLGVMTRLDGGLASTGLHNGQGYIADLRVNMGAVETPETERHFGRGRPWYRKDRLLGDNGSFRLDRYGNFWAAGATG